ncbi:MAG: TIGR04255 family protein [Flammeovirgaceae bacterium]
MTKKYPNSPLTEVIAEFNFIPSNPWNATIPGLLYEKIKLDFPDIKQRIEPVQIFTPIDESNSNQATRRFDQVELVQFWSKNLNSLVQSGRDILTINHVKPYPSWEVFFPKVKKVLSVSNKISKPKGLSRVSLRYINTIQIDSKKNKFSDGFQFSLPKPKNLKSEPRFFTTHIEFAVNERDVISQKILHGIALNQKSDNFILDIEFVMNQFNGLKISDIEKWLENAHNVINETFEQTLSENLKKTFY